nr:ROK family protein [Borrelia miyamotoi]
MSVEIEKDANCLALAKKLKVISIYFNNFVALILEVGIDNGIFMDGKNF